MKLSAPPGINLERPPAAPPPRPPEASPEEPARTGGWVRAGLLATGIATAAAGVAGYAVLHQPNPLDNCGSPEVHLEQQLDEATYQLELDGSTLCVDAPGRAGDYSVSYQDGSYRVQTRTVYRDYQTQAQGEATHDDYEVPHEHSHDLVGADESQRTSEAAERQEEALEQALAQHREELGPLLLETGVVTFPNSQADPEPLLANRLTVDGQHFYTLNDSSGSGLLIFSERPWDEHESLDALARLADYRATVPDHLATGAISVEFRPGSKPGSPWAAATYHDKDQVVFWNGTRNLSERVFVHELGHAAGYDQGRETRGPVDRILSWFGEGAGVPEGWEEASHADGEHVSQYARTNEREDFAESFLAYLDARAQGKLGEFREAFPNRTELLDQVFLATS